MGIFCAIAQRTNGLDWTFYRSLHICAHVVLCSTSGRFAEYVKQFSCRERRNAILCFTKTIRFQEIYHRLDQRNVY